MNTKEVETSAGKFLLKKPLAGARNEAVMKDRNIRWNKKFSFNG